MNQPEIHTNRRLLIGAGLVILVVAFLAIAILLTTSSGQSDDDSFGSAPTTAQITIDQPPAGAIIYAETLRVSGTSSENSGTFLVQIVEEDRVLASAPVRPDGMNWSVEIPHAYAGQTTEVEIRAVSPDVLDQPFDQVPVFLSQLMNRPSGAYATITTHQDGDNLGGDTVLIEGRVSGVDSFVLALIDDAGAVIDERTILVNNPFLVDDLPWQADIATNAYAGPATLRMTSKDADLLEVNVTVSNAAG